MATTYVWRDGARLTPWMLYVITMLDADLSRAFGVHVIVTSAIRTYAEQEAIFRARYVTAGNVNGRRVYDTRVWKGVRWYRISSAGTVAVPGSSNHEIQGDKAAVDIRDTGSDAGITVASSKRGRWIREWCRSKGLLIASGDGFGEGWHFDVPGIFRTPPSNGGGSTSKEIKVKHYFRDDGKALRKGGIDLSPNEGTWLHTSSTVAQSQASNLVGGIGEYQFTEHVYAQGTPGDVVDLVLAWDDTKTSGPHSMHFVERIEIGADGFARRNVPFARAVARGYAVYARLATPSTNKGVVKITRFASDALLFVAS